MKCVEGQADRQNKHEFKLKANPQKCKLIKGI